MTKRMLIDASHAEETRVVVLEGNRLEDYDVETSTKKQLKGNIYLAKVVRVEPSLQAAFVEYGGNRHGFLAFGEIHPDYYQIPVADRQRLIELQEQEAREEEEAEDRAAAAAGGYERDEPPTIEAVADDVTGIDTTDKDAEAPAPQAEYAAPQAEYAASQPKFDAPQGESDAPQATFDAPHAEYGAPQAAASMPEPAAAPRDDAPDSDPDGHPARTQPALMAQDMVTGPVVTEEFPAGPDQLFELGAEFAPEAVEPVHAHEAAEPPAPPPETIGGESEERSERRPPPRFLRNYKIQEVIRRRQILLIQVVKEERGTKGAALTTYVSLAGRFSVLMPNSPRGGGISRKITSAADRKRLREVITELGMPRGMGLIVRTAGANRPKPEIKRDCEYLLRLWDDIRDRTMASSAPALIYEEANLIKRTIRDVYSRDIDEVLVDGEDAWRAARDFMRMLMPSHARKVQLWKDGGVPLFSRNQVDAQLDAMLTPTVQLRSGGYLVINQTEALVAIDVNSGRSTRERGIEETALRTNLEAAEEVARQLRLRDLAGLIVIDFIDMEAKKHNAMVERRIKDSLKNDRARIQVGHISHFGLLEMSRQRLRPSITETSFVACPHCGGAGHVRSTESAALHVLRAIEEEGGKRRAAEIVVHVAQGSALYILNNKRERLAEIEARCMMRVSFAADPSLLPSDLRIERVRAQNPDAMPPPAIRPDVPALTPSEADIADLDVVEEADEIDAGDEAAPAIATRETAVAGAPAAAVSTASDAGPEGESAEEGEHRRRRRRRRRRGGATGRREDFGSGPQPDMEAAAPEQPSLAPESAAPAQIAESVAQTGESVAQTGESPAQTVEPVAELNVEMIVEPVEAASPVEAVAIPAATPAVASAVTVAAAPAAEPEEERTPRRRSPRGGRRRRPEAQPEAAPPPPAYVGPTPADPFGGHNYDIFDAIEQATAAQAQPAPAPPPVVHAEAPRPVEIAPPVLIDPTPALEIPPPPPALPARAPEAARERAPGPEPAHEPTLAPVVVTATSAPQPETAVGPEPKPEPEIGPAVQPVVIAGTPPAAERKRGWWSR